MKNVFQICVAKLTSRCPLLKNLDLFGIPIELSFENQGKYRSYCGAIVSVLLFAISFSLLISQMIKWLQMDTSTVIFSTENFSINGLFAEKHNISYELNYKNYNIYFAVYADLPDKTSLTFKELEKYVKIQIKYSASGYSNDFENIEYEYCNFRKQRMFLGVPYDEIQENETSIWSMCLVNPLKMGLFIDEEMSDIQNPILMLEIKQCQNSTFNNNFCASQEEIVLMLKYIDIQITVPRTNYDFKNQSHPIKRLYIYEHYKPDFKFKKTIINKINPSILFSDQGLINDDYQLNSINFNSGQQILDIYTKNEEDNILFEYKINLSFQIDQFYIRNQKLNSIIGSFGGLIHLFYSLGAFFCYRLNRFFLFNSLTDFTFGSGHLAKTKEKVHPKYLIIFQTSKTFYSEDTVKTYSSPKIRFNFVKAFYSIIRFKKKEYDSYQKTRKLLNEYIDLKKIISKLQEIDNLKEIFLEEYQRFFFDLIPRPDIFQVFKEREIISKNNLKKEKRLENYQVMITKKNLINDKILNLLGKDKLNIIKLSFKRK